MACAGRRQAYFRGEFFATLRILQTGEIAPEALVGSWAGAFGQTQFMPSTYERLAVDLDGDGRRDIIGSAPDALGSTANFLKRAGWQGGQAWGYEVRIPADYAGPSGRGNRQALQAWAKLGVRLPADPPHPHPLPRLRGRGSQTGLPLPLPLPLLGEGLHDSSP